MDHYDQLYRSGKDLSSGDETVIHLLDRINLVKAKKIFKYYNGWPSILTTNDPNYIALFLTIHHSNHDTQKKYFPVLRQASIDNKIKSSSIALLEDRILAFEGKPQIYGTQIRRNPQNGNYYVYPIKDAEEVEERRQRVGLPTLTEYVKNWDINLEELFNPRPPE